jgi:hypothetical protein
MHCPEQASQFLEKYFRGCSHWDIPTRQQNGSDKPDNWIHTRDNQINTAGTFPKIQYRFF